MSIAPESGDAGAELSSKSGASAAPSAAGAAEAAQPEPQTAFPCGAERSIELGPSGFRAPRWPERGEAFVAYRDVTHIAPEPRGLAIGTQHGVILLSRASLGGARACDALADALRARVFALPSGAALQARFAQLDARIAAGRPWIAALLVALTGVVFVCQKLVPGFYDAAIYRPQLLALGEWWRYVAAQFLHGGYGHLATNALAALFAGAYAERSLGRMGTLFVAGAAGAGAMLASRFGGYQELLGFSGVAAGFFGAITALEYFAPGETPASARLPRSVLLAVIAFEVVRDLMPSPPLPVWATHIAGWAHLGGFLGGGLAALIAARARVRALVVAGAVASLVSFVAAFGIVAQTLARPDEARERLARELRERGSAHPGELNNLAWQIATSREPSEAALAEAEKLATRAVQLTGASEPTVLDTLAEVYFAQGRSDEAIAVIDQAIALAPGESYYAEQRRRFTGERAADDRPPEPEQAPGQPPARDAAPGDDSRERELPPGDEITV